MLCELLTGERQPLWCSPEGRQAWLKALHESSGAGAEYLHQSQPLTFEALGRLVHGSVIQMAVTCLSPDGAAKAVVRYAAPGLMLNVLRADTLEPICTVIDDKAAVPPGAAVQVAFMQILGKQWAVTVLCGDHVATVFMIPGSGWARLSIPGNDSAFSVADRPSAGTSGAAPAEQSLVTSAVQIIDEFFMMPRCPNPDCRVAFAIDFSQSLAVACECCNSYFCVWCNVIYPDSLAAHNCTCFTEGKFPMWAHSAADQEMYRQRHLASVRGGIEVFLQALQRSAAAEVRRRLGF
jgi:hypothetical protein